MYDEKVCRPGDGADGSPPSEAYLFAHAIQGKAIPIIVAPEPRAVGERREVERLATFSPAYAEALRGQATAEAASGRERECLKFAAEISDDAAAQLRAIVAEEVAERDAWRRAEEFAERLSSVRRNELRNPGLCRTNSVTITEYDPNQPRQPKGSPAGGRWAPAGGGAAMGASARWYLPSDGKGTWLGKKGESTFRLKTPVDVNGKLVHDIEYHKGVPILDKFKLPGNTATIVLTGDYAADLRHAEDAWRKLNPGKKLPKEATFHHDLLHVTEHIEMINGKKTKVLVGKMPLIPRKLHTTIAHQGTASVARRFNEGLSTKTKDAFKKVSKHQASLAGTGKDFVAKAARKIKPGKITKGISRLVGRTVVRAIPIIGTGLAVLEFADNVEAHGVGGALARATPILGDLISAHDLGSDLAKQIIDEANKNRDEHLRTLNDQVAQAWKEASDQTLAAFHSLAGQIEVTNTPDYQTGQLVDPDESADALNEYRNNMQAANHQRIAGQPGFNFRAAAARNKQQLKRALERASQKRAAPPKPGSMM